MSTQDTILLIHDKEYGTGLLLIIVGLYYLIWVWYYHTMHVRITYIHVYMSCHTYIIIYTSCGDEVLITRTRL